MISNTPYNQLRQLLMERLGYKNVTELYERYEIGEPYEEYTLQDVLLAIKERYANNNDLGICLDLGGSEILVLSKEPTRTKQFMPYDLTKNLANQSDETLLALIELIK